METPHEQAIHDVIIAGAGPVGLFLAGELALAGCAVLVLEQAAHPHSPLKQFPFGMRGLNAPSVEALYRRGLLHELEVPRRRQSPHQPAGPDARRQAGHFAGIPLYADDVEAVRWPYRLPGSPPPLLLAELEELETVLARRAVALGVVIERGQTIAALRQTAEGVTVEAGGRAWQGGWLVGCDGGRSAVRKLGGFDFVGTEPAFTGYSARVDLADPEKLWPGRNVTPHGMYLQSQPDYVILQDFDGGAMHQARPALTREHVQAVLRRISGTDVTVRALHAATTWTDRARQATTYRHGRVLLAGDAAHIHSPLGGQGLNLGLGDALNLGWKLAATAQHRAPQGLLDTYTAERHPLGAQVLDWSRAQVALMKPDPGARALYAVVADLLHTPDGAAYAAGRVWGLLTRYPLGDGHPLTGRSAPDFELAEGRRLGELLRDGRGLLLDLTDDAALQALAGAYDRLPYLAARASEPLGLGALLVRPDGYVAWAADTGAPDYDGCRQAAARWFGARA